MNPLRHQNYKNESTWTKNSWYGWLMIYIPELKKCLWVVLKTKLRVLLKQTRRRVIVIQNMTIMDRKVERNQVISKIKKKTIRRRYN